MSKKTDSARIVIVRHADAGDRGAYSGPDFERPLSPKGEKQSKKIAKRLESEHCRLVASSPAVRCIATLTPFAKATGMEIDRVEELAEGSDPAGALQWLIDHASDLAPREMIVGCSHGDVLSGILESLHDRGLGVDGGVFEVQKAGSIELTLADGAIAASRLLQAP